ncbi:FAD-binding domain-containing protein [Fomes fomentarius]|nr:FAD-binding domain-containing protein [Fomes fomentarius]
MTSFDSFARSFQGDLVAPGHSEYAASLHRWAANAERNAKLVAFVRNADDVSRAIKYARAENLPIAVRGGGHSASGASSTEGGLVIDLSRYLNGAEIDAEKKLGYVGGGAVWETVDKAAIAHGLATVGGTVNHCYVGAHQSSSPYKNSLITGGGIGWLSGAYGLAIDSLRQATVVTADGSILTASETENPDLFWGIRGAGSNLGIVTEFVLELYPQRATVYSGVAIYPLPLLQKLNALTDEWWKNGPSEKEAMLQAWSRGPDGNPFIAVFFFYNGSEEEGRANFKEFLDLGPMMDLTREIPYEFLNTLQNDGVKHGQNVYMRGVSQSGTPSKDFSQAAVDYVGKFTESGEFRVGLLYEYYPVAKVNAVASNATAFPRPIAGNILTMIFWDEHSDEKAKRAREAAHELGGIITGSADATDSYGNYNSDEAVESGDKSKTLFGENYGRLQELKQRYDPDNVFNKWFAVTPTSD